MKTLLTLGAIIAGAGATYLLIQKFAAKQPGLSEAPEKVPVKVIDRINPIKLPVELADKIHTASYGYSYN
ncbi:MAG TPA: hypothetical protein VEA37_02255 [Flavobacterium sp.]|nr:hypothetical protein [Flavobacterium sp.]